MTAVYARFSLIHLDWSSRWLNLRNPRRRPIHEGFAKSVRLATRLYTQTMDSEQQRKFQENKSAYRVLKTKDNQLIADLFVQNCTSDKPANQNEQSVTIYQEHNTYFYHRSKNTIARTAC